MSSIDQRIVQMRFDNKEFESNAGTTMSTLEKLKEKLKFTKSDEGIKSLQNSFNGFNLSGIQTGVDSISDRFSALGIAGMEVIRRLTNAAIDMGERIAKSFTIDPIMDGFAEYELKMGSVQTILMGARTDEGLPVTLDMVNQKLNELNTYADKTIYSFSDMTSSIGKFTNAGVSLDKSVAAIQGISNVAALSGANAQQASHAMYNFAQALSSGAVKLIDWKSIENANMATVEFKQTLIDTALEVGTLVEEGGEYVSTTTDMQGKVSEAFTATSKFNDSLSAQWMTADVLTAALAKYSDETTELGKKAFEAATQVKTWSQLKDTVKEALGSGWAQTWEYIIGDFEEAKVMWTNLNNVISGIIDPIADARNEMFKFWHDNGGRDAMLEAFGALWEKLQGVSGEIKAIGSDAFERMFGTFDGSSLVAITKAVRDFFKNLTVSDSLNNAFTTVVTTFFNVLEGGVTQLMRAGRFISALWKAIEPGREILYNIIGAVADTISIISGMLNRIGNVFENNGGLQALANGIANIFNGILTVVKPVVDAINRWFQDLYNSEFVTKVGTKLAEIAKAFERFTAAIDFKAIANDVMSLLSGFTKVLSGIWTYISPVVSGIDGFISSLLGLGDSSETAGDKAEVLKSKMSSIKDTLADIKNNGIQWFIDNAPADLVGDVSIAIGKLNEHLQPLRERIAAIKESFEDGTWYSRLKVWLEGTVENVVKLKDTIGEFVKDSAVNAFTAVWETIAGAFNTFVGALKSGWSLIKPILQSLFGDNLYTAVNRIFEFMAKFAGVRGLYSITDTIRGFSNLIGGLADGLDKLKTNLEKSTIHLEKSLLAPLKSAAKKNTSEAIRNVAISIAILAGSLVALSFVEFDKLQNGIITVGELLTMIIGFYAAMEVISKKLHGIGAAKNGGLLGGLLGGITGGGSITSNSIGFIALAASILMMASALSTLSDIPFIDIQKGLLAIGELMAGLWLFAKYADDVKVGGVDITFLSVAIDLLSVAIKKVGDMDFESLLKGLGGLAIILIEITAFMHDMKDVDAKGFTGVITLAAGIRVLVSSVKALGGLDLANLAKGLGGLAIVLIELYFFTKKMADIDTGGFAGIIVLAVGLRLLVNSVKALGALDIESLLKGLGGVAILLIELSWFMHDMGNATAMSIAAAAAIVVLAAGLRILAMSVKALGGMDTGSMIQGLAGLAVVLIELSIACRYLDDVSPKLIITAAAMVIMSAAILLLVPAIQALGNMDFLSLIQGLAGIAAVFVIFGAAGAILGPLAIQMIATAAAIALMAAAVWIVVPPLMALGQMPLSNLGMALLSLAGVFVIFGAAGLILGPLAPLMIAAAAGILAMDASAAGAGVAMIAIAEGMARLGVAIPVFTDSILALLQSILGGLPFIGDDIDAWFEERRAAIRGSMNPEEAEKTGSDWTKGLTDGVNSGKEGLKAATNEVTQNASQQAKQAGSGFNSGFLEGLNFDDIKGVVTGDTDAMGETVKRMMSENGLDAGSMLGDNMLQGFDESDLEGMLTGDMGDMTGDIKEMMSEAGLDTGEAYMSGMKQSVEQHAPGLYLTVGNETKYVTQETLEHYKNMGFITGQEYTQAIADKAETGFGEVKIATETAFDRIAGIDITQPGATVGDSFIEGLRQKSSKLRQTVEDDLGNEVTDGLESTDTESSGESLMEKFADGMLDSKNDVEDSAEEVAGSAENILEDSYDGGYNGGQNFGYGFGDGTSSTSSYVESAASTLARNALNAMKNELQEASPSKATRKFGKFGGMGLALGFKDTTQEVKNKASALADTGLKAMQQSMEHLRSLLDFDADIDPTIRPVLDLQQIQNGMATIGSMFGGSQFSFAGGLGIDAYALTGIRSASAAASESPIGDQSVVNAIGDLKTEISTLKSAMEQMKFEADGKTIGEVAYKEVDRRLGNAFVRNRREGRG